MPKRSSAGDLFDGPAFQRSEPQPSKRDARIQQLEDALDKAQKRARAWEMSYMGMHRAQIRLIAILLDLGVPGEKLAEWQKSLDYIEAAKMNEQSRVKSVVLAMASELCDVE